jgi:flagellar biosynthetic protein FliO
MQKFVRKLVLCLLVLLVPLGLNAANEQVAELTEQRATEVATTPAADPAVEPSPPPTESSRPNRVVSRDAVLNPGADNSSGSMALGKIAISLALVILLVLGLGWLFKKLTLRLPGSRHMKVICAMPLGQRERILVIEMQGKQRVIGVTPHSINLLFELENPLPEEKLASDFHTQLQSFLKK